MDGTRAVGIEYVQSGADQGRARRTRGHPRRRRDQFAAASDAVRHRRSRRAEGARHRDAHSAQRRRQEPARPHLGCDHVPPQAARPVPAQHAARPRRARARRRPISSARASPPTCRSASPRSSRRGRRNRCRTSRCCSGWARPTPPRPICRRSRRRSPTASRAASCRCGRSAAAASSSPRPIRRASVRIHQNFLGTEEEWRVMRDGIRMIRDVVRQPALAPFVDGEIAPGADKTSDADIEAHVRATMGTVHHPVGTCMMGPASDDMAVVDGDLRVIGARTPARGRCLGDAGPDRRRDQRAGHHDRREGRGHDPRPARRCRRPTSSRMHRTDREDERMTRHVSWLRLRSLLGLTRRHGHAQSWPRSRCG